jgi:hypothetical protein
MQHIFINSEAVIYPSFYVIYRLRNGEHYQRIESAIDSHSFEKDSEAVRIELYENSTSKMVKPVLLDSICRGD